jgi:NDP-sugar pyrophosphorylase family protein
MPSLEKEGDRGKNQKMNKINRTVPFIVETAFILGAGLGTRLRPLTESTPKPLLEVGGYPMITYAMAHLKAAGIRRFIVNTHHRAEKYADAFPDHHYEGIPITFRHEPILLDTAGGIKNIEDLITEDERLMVYNGDIITSMPVEGLMQKHFELSTPVTLALRSTGPLLNVSVDQEGFVCDMRHILKNDGVKKCLFAGIYILEKSFLKRLTAGKIESIVVPLVEMIRENPRSVGAAVIDDGLWYDVGTVEEYNRLKETGLPLSCDCGLPVMPGRDENGEQCGKR